MVVDGFFVHYAIMIWKCSVMVAKFFIQLQHWKSAYPAMVLVAVSAWLRIQNLHGVGNVAAAAAAAATTATAAALKIDLDR